MMTRPPGWVRGMIHVHISIFNNPSTNTSESSPCRRWAKRAAGTGGQAGVGGAGYQF